VKSLMDDALCLMDSDFEDGAVWRRCTVVNLTTKTSSVCRSIETTTSLTNLIKQLLTCSAQDFDIGVELCCTHSSALPRIAHRPHRENHFAAKLSSSYCKFTAESNCLDHPPSTLAALLQAS
jgi:hypothetical protein